MDSHTFTPGPWKIAGFGSQNNNKMDFGINTELGQLVIESYGQCELDCKANAALIAAAPEMYEFIRWIRSAQGQCAIMKWRKFLPEILDKADEILHKAEGEE